MVKDNKENIVKSVVEEVKVESKPKKTRKTTAKSNNVNKKENVKKNSDIDLDSILNFETKSKSAMSFNQNKSVADKLNELATAKNVKASKVLNTVLTSIVDVGSRECKIAIEEEREEKIQNTYKIDTDVLDVLKAEAKKRNMSLNDYLNKVLEKVFNL